MRSARAVPRWDVAIHAPLAGPLYLADHAGWTGGAELQAHYLARALADRGLRVAHILLADPALPKHRDGVDLVLQIPKARGPKGTRRVPPLWGALARADASVYVQRSAGLATGVVGAFARTRHRRFVYSLSSTWDLDPGAPSIDGALKELGLRLADRVVTQTDEQQRIAVRKFGTKAKLVRSFCEPISVCTTPEVFLWIGGLIEYKHPLAYLELAERVPDAQFVMVATPRPGWEQLAQEVSNRARSMPNLRLCAPRPRNELLGLYARAVAVVNTSKFEGFPNTFMEAWACGVPTLSLNVDPDRVIVRHGLGAVADGSVDRLAELARMYWARRGDLTRAETTKEYVRREHDHSVIGDAWTHLIAELISAQTPKSRSNGVTGRGPIRTVRAATEP